MKRTPTNTHLLLGRRDLFRTATYAAAASFAGSTAAAPAQRLPTRGKGPDVYRRVGIEPFINLTSARTMNGGSLLLPEVADAIHEASFYHVNLQELLLEVCPRIADLLGVPGAMVGSGAAGSLTIATLACMTGGNIETLQQLPNTEGVKDEVVAVQGTRSVYDHAIRMTGAKMINVSTPGDLAGAFGPQTFMAFAGQRIQEADSKMPLEKFVEAARARGVPVLIDAANELPVNPDPFLARGADLVAYSGGKSLQGPQSAGLLLGRKDLTDAAYVSSAPHHTFARPMKVSKEEIVGALVAVEYLVTKRNAQEESEKFKFWYRHIRNRITQVPGVRAEIIEATRPNGHPKMNVEWDMDKIGLVAREVGEQLLNGKPRIISFALPKELDPTAMETNTFEIRPMAMQPEDYEIVAERLHEVFKNAPGPKPKPAPKPPAGSLDGHWDVEIAFVAQKAHHTMYLQNRGNEITGLHRGRIAQGKVEGEIDGDQVYFESRGRYEAAHMMYFFKGRLSGDEMGGELGLGEYGKATWKARRA